MTLAQAAAYLGLTRARVRQLDRELKPVITPRGTSQKRRMYRPEILEEVAKTRVKYLRRDAHEDPSTAGNHSAGMRALWSVFRHNHCEERGLKHELTLEQFARLVAGPCLYCGEPPSERRVSGYYRVLAHGLDRIDNTKGYTEDNVEPCCWRCNRWKHTMTVEEFIAHVRKIEAWTRGLG